MCASYYNVMTDYTVLARISVTLVGVSVALCSIRGEAMEDSEGGGGVEGLNPSITCLYSHL